MAKLNPLAIGGAPAMPEMKAMPQQATEAEELPDGASQMEAMDFYYGKLQKSEALMQKTREAFSGLAELGENVTLEEVVKASGRLVAAGLPADAIAAGLADMPEKPELLAQWVQERVEEAGAAESQLEEMMQLARHQYGTEAMRMLLGTPSPEGASSASAEAGIAPEGPPNALAIN